MIDKEGTWIKFELTCRNLKTETWAVITRRNGLNLGAIKWAPRWRRYAFFTYKETTIRGFNIVNSPNMLRQFKNKIKIGFACISIDKRDPS